ncbi:MAG: hypothetical protein IH899_10425 [Planctomycetes bacterium]|nr:hypothetical protein [Planctomycetota bacterium]
MIRIGLVRCWICGSFMRKEIAKLFQKLRQAPTPVIYSDLPADEIEDRSNEQLEDDMATDAKGPVFADDEDFVPDDEGFEIAEGVIVTRSSAMAESDSDAYHLDQTNEASSDNVDTKQASSPADDADDADDAGDAEKMKQNAEKQTGDNQSEQTQETHSVSTGGDALLQVALEEEAESKQSHSTARRTGAANPRYHDGILIYCPNGHRIEVRERHRGMTGRCPRCKAPFFVPETPNVPKADQQPESSTAEAAPTADAPATAAAGQYQHWLADVHVHTVNRKKLKLKPGSLEKEFELFDFGFSGENILAVKLPAGKGGKKKGLLGSKKKGKEEAASEETTPRDQMLSHLREGKPLEELPADAHYVLDAEAVQQIKIAQPILYAHESMFAGVPVFGDGRIAVWLPSMEEDGNPRCAAFLLSQFREFSRFLDELFGIKGLGGDCDVPLTDSYNEQKCQFSDKPLKLLKEVDYYQADPAFSLQLLGWKCAGCGMFVSEDARKKEKIGGPKPNSVPKAICPKCKKKFGNNPFYALADGSQSDE